MARRDTGTDDPRVRVRPGRGSRPRTKRRPAHADAHLGMVTRIDRGHYRIRLEDPSLSEDGTGDVTAMKARELGRGKVVVGDRVAVVGDVSGRAGSLARLVRVEERRTLLRRSSEDGDAAGSERPVVANADLLVVVVSVASPPPRPRMVDRLLVAAYGAGMEPLLVLTKTDLADPGPLLGMYAPLGVATVATGLDTGPDTGLDTGLAAGLAAGLSQATSPAQATGTGQGLPGGPGERGLRAAGRAAAAGQGHPEVLGRGVGPSGVDLVRQALAGRVSVLVGHSGVGKSTLVNALVPQADRATGEVNAVTGRGRHTSTSLQALELPGGGWVIDTPGVRSFGVSHVGAADVLRAFPDLDDVAQDCPRGCTHLEGAQECALDTWAGPPQHVHETSKAAPGPHEAAGGTTDPVAGGTTAPATLPSATTFPGTQQARRRARVESFRRLLTPSLEAQDPARQR